MKKEKQKIRTKRMRNFGVDIPDSARMLMNWAMSGDRPRTQLSFSVNALPPTINHMYIQVGRRRVLSEEAQNFRKYVGLSIGSNRFHWKPKGAVMSIIFLESPHWITKKHTIRDMDGDNRLKAFFDAIQEVTGINDNTNWQFHCYKIASSQVRTTAYLFDLGDLIEWYP